MPNDNIAPALQRGLVYLGRTQAASGGFVSQSSTLTSPWQPTYHYQTSFVPSLILNCLVSVDGSKATAISDKIAAFLLTQKSANWSFNYWQRNAPESHRFPYPDDLDDTFCALIGLQRHRPELITKAALAQIVHLLLATETTVGGPYRTWLVNRKSEAIWQDVDLAVNANIAYFLSLIGSTSPTLLKYLTDRLQDRDYTSPYYPSHFPVWYYLARVCPVSERTWLRQTIQNASNGSTSSLAIALALSALQELATPVNRLQPYAQTLLNAQLPDGSWPADAFCLDPQRQTKDYFHGAPSLTTAFALQGLARYQRQPYTAIQRPATLTRETRLQQQIVDQAQQDIAALMPDLQQQAANAIHKIIAGDQEQQITLMAYRFARALSQPPAFEPNFYCFLGLANLYGWLAYTIYDDFLDDAGRAKLLPVANFGLRASVEYFRRALPAHPGFNRLVQQTFHTIDGANSWELANCRSPTNLPHYGQRAKLAERSWGHSLTPVAVLMNIGYGVHSREVKLLQQVMRHYLIARQLDDDTHDWQTDLANGHMSYVVTTLLQTSGQPANNSPHQLQRVFWYKTLPQVCHTMQQHLDRARKQLTKSSLLASNYYLQQLLTEIDESAQKTLVKQHQAAEFLTTYQGFAKK